MASADETPSATSSSELRIVRLNTDKTRRTLGSSTVYQVYFELSDYPPLAWREIFGGNGKASTPRRRWALTGDFL